MTKQHYGALAGVILGYAFCRILSFGLVDIVGDVSGHHRSIDTVIGVVFAALPFLTLIAFTVLHLRSSAVLHRRPFKAVLVLGWALAGGVLGMLPYSRAGTEENLRVKEHHTAPGFLHGVDVTIFVGLCVTVALLLVALRRRPVHDTPAADWLEAQFEDES